MVFLIYLMGQVLVLVSCRQTMGGLLAKRIPYGLPLRLVKMIMLTSLGSPFLEAKHKWLGQVYNHGLLALSLGLSWMIHLWGYHPQYMVFLLGLISIRPYLTLNRDYKDKCRLIEGRLPQILGQMNLLIGAGMTPVKALEYATRSQKDIITSQLYRVTQEVRLGGYFQKRMMNFMTLCQHTYLTRFGRILLMYDQNGTYASKKLLQELLEDLWKQKRSVTIKKGEEASTHLLIPMAIALIGTMVTMIVPALYEIFTFT